jgi:protein required for attachment to host cells
MLKTCVLVADRARARLFVLESPPPHIAQAPLRLRELGALTNPAGELVGSEMFASTRSGSNRAPPGAALEYDDHREQHRQELAKQFAKEVATAAVALVRQQHAQKLVLAAEPRFLGFLREVLPSMLPEGISFVELARDLSKQTPIRIKAVLSKHGAFTKSN